MKIGVIGSRDFDNYNLVRQYLNLLKPTAIISGGARGADSFGEKYADDNNIEKLIFPADWEKHKKAAGYIRNVDIVKNSDMILAFWDKKSKGTRHSIKIANENNVPTLIVYF